MKKGIKIAILACFFVVMVTTMARSEGVSLGIKGGTLGIGPEIGFRFTKFLGARIGFNYLPISYSSTKADIDYDFDLNLQSISGILDFHPFKNAFRVSGGVFYNGNNLDASGKDSSGSYKIGGQTYPAVLVGNLDGKIDFNDSSPYCGIGFDTTFGKEKDFGLMLELGVLFQGSPKVSLTADGPISGNPLFQKNLAEEEEKLKNKLEKVSTKDIVCYVLLFR